MHDGCIFLRKNTSCCKSYYGVTYERIYRQIYHITKRLVVCVVSEIDMEIGASQSTPLIICSGANLLPHILLYDIISGSRGGLFGAGGRFKGGTDPIMEKFNESINFDKR